MTTFELGNKLVEELQRLYGKRKATVTFDPKYIPDYCPENPSFPAVLIRLKGYKTDVYAGNDIMQKYDPNLYIDCEYDDAYVVGLTPDDTAPIGKDPAEGTKRKPITKGFPPEIEAIHKKWSADAHAYGDAGSCVIGECLNFKYKGLYYRMYCDSGWQGSLGAEHYEPETQKALAALGADEFYFDYGMMD